MNIKELNILLKKYLGREALDEISYYFCIPVLFLWALFLTIPFLPLIPFRLTVNPGTPDVWWAWRVLGNHWVVYAIIGAFALCAFLLERPKGLKILADVTFFIVLSNDLWTIAYYQASGIFQYGFWFQLIPLTLTAGVVMRGHSFKDTMIILGTFAGVMTGYLMVWMGIGFPISAGATSALWWVNLIEIGYWSVAALTMLILIRVLKR